TPDVSLSPGRFAPRWAGAGARVLRQLVASRPGGGLLVHTGVLRHRRSVGDVLGEKPVQTQLRIRRRAGLRARDCRGDWSEGRSQTLGLRRDGGNSAALCPGLRDTGVSGTLLAR